jgi:hypothetical protein
MFTCSAMQDLPLVRLHLCVYVCSCVDMCSCEHVYVPVCVYKYECVGVCVCVCVCMCVRMPVCVSSVYVTCVRVCVFLSMYIYIYLSLFLSLLLNLHIDGCPLSYSILVHPLTLTHRQHTTSALFELTGHASCGAGEDVSGANRIVGQRARGQSNQEECLQSKESAELLSQRGACDQSTGAPTPLTQSQRQPRDQSSGSAHLPDHQLGRCACGQPAPALHSWSHRESPGAPAAHRRSPCHESPGAASSFGRPPRHESSGAVSSFGWSPRHESSGATAIRPGFRGAQSSAGAARQHLVCVRAG